MSPLVALGGLAAALLGASSASYELDLRTELRTASDPSPAPRPHPLDGAQEVDPRAAGMLKAGGVTVTGSYSPRLYWIEPQPTASPNVLHRAQLQLDDTWGLRRRIFASEDAAYGINYFSPLGGTGGAAPMAMPGGGTAALPAVPSVLLAHYVSSATAVGTDLELNPEWHFAATAQYVLSGGSDRIAQLEIPLQRGPRFDAALAWSSSRLDTFTTQISALRATFTTGQLASIAQVSESWRTRLSRTVTGEVFAGGAAVQNQGALGDPSSEALPVGGARLEVKEKIAGIPSNAKLALFAAPFLDVYAATVYERGEADASVGFDWERWEFNAGLRGTQLLTGYERRGETLVVGELTTAHLLLPDVKLEGGLRLFWQHGLEVVGAPFQWTVFVSLTGVQKGAVAN